MKSLFVLLSFFVAAPIGISLSGATPNNEFHFNNGAEPEGLDPHRSQSHDAAQLNYQLFDSLVNRKNDYFSLRPGVAESWTTSKDGLTWTFKIRKNLKWSDGEPMTIEQVRGSFIRAMNPQVAAPYINWYSDFIAGAADLVKNYSTGARATAEKALGITIKGPDTLEIKLIQPVAFFAYLLSNPVFAIVPPKMYDASSKAWQDPTQFVSSGAYKLTEWKVNQRIVMERNASYWDNANTQIQKLVSYPIADQQTTLNMYNSGQLDWTGENTINPNLVQTLKARPDFKFTTTFGTYLYVFNTKKAPFDKANIRKAFALAINCPEITDKVSKSGVVPAYRLVPPGVPAYKESAGYATDYKVRVAEAKELLKKEGYPDGKGLPEITLLYNTNEGHHRIAQAVQRMWKEALNVDVVISNSEWKVVLAEQKAGNFQVVRYGWIGDYPDPSTFIDFLLTKSENNNGKYSSKIVDDSLSQANSERDPAKRFALLGKAERQILDDAAVAPIYHYVYYSLMTPRVAGFAPNMFGHYYFKDLAKK